MSVRLPLVLLVVLFEVDVVFLVVSAITLDYVDMIINYNVTM